MAYTRLLVVSTVVDRKTGESFGKACGFIHRVNGKAFKRTYRNSPSVGYDIQVEVIDTWVQKRFQELTQQGASVLNFKK